MIGGGFRTADEADLDTIATIHLAAYSRDHFTSLLPRPVLADYYRLFLGGGTDILLHVGSDGVADGFAVYGRRIPERIALFKRQRWGSILLTALGHPFRSVSKTAKRFTSRLRPGRSSAAPADFLLLSIAVGRKGGGIGTALLHEMIARVDRGDVPIVGLYVNCSNIGAVNLYFQVGFRVNAIEYGQYYMERSAPKLP